MNKKDISANDETGVIKITLWGSRIANVPSDGVYFVKNAMVNEFRNAISLNTNHHTKFSLSDRSINKSKTTLFITDTVYFPQNSVAHFELIYAVLNVLNHQDMIAKHYLSVTNVE